jgi:hypothetical protein
VPFQEFSITIYSHVTCRWHIESIQTKKPWICIQYKENIDKNDTSTVSLVIFYFFIHACNKIIDSQYAKHYFLNILWTLTINARNLSCKNSPEGSIIDIEINRNVTMVTKHIMDRHVAPLEHIIQIPSQPVFALSP